MYKQTDIRRMISNPVWIGSGCSAKVYAVGGTGWVIKHASEKDGTLNYLQWCLLKQQRGEFMQGMPEIDFITLYGDGGGYSVGMKQYEPQTSNVRYNPWCDNSKVPTYLLRLINAYKEYAFEFLGLRNAADDCHEGNIMVDAVGGFVLTDPCAESYHRMLPPSDFELTTVWWGC